MSEKLILGFIGNGKSTNRYHAPFILTRRDTIQIKTIWARNLNKTDWARIDGVHYTENIDEVLNDPEIDVVVITLPHHLHYEYIKKVLEAGKNCVCEKPFVETKAQAEELFALAKEKGLMLQCYQNCDYNCLALRLIDIDAVFIVDRDHFLTNHRNDTLIPVVQFEVQSKDITSQLPSQSFDICDILYHMEKLIREVEFHSIRHRDKMDFMHCEYFPLNMSNLFS